MANFAIGVAFRSPKQAVQTGQLQAAPRTDHDQLRPVAEMVWNRVKSVDNTFFCHANTN